MFALRRKNNIRNLYGKVPCPVSSVRLSFLIQTLLKKTRIRSLRDKETVKVSRIARRGFIIDRAGDEYSLFLSFIWKVRPYLACLCPNRSCLCFIVAENGCSFANFYHFVCVCMRTSLSANDGA